MPTSKPLLDLLLVFLFAALSLSLPVLFSGCSACPDRVYTTEDGARCWYRRTTPEGVWLDGCNSGKTYFNPVNVKVSCE